jgi:hypothetical protein
MIYVIIRDSYVVNRIIADTMPANYPHPHDLIIEDADATVFIGDWYEYSEGMFYRPIGVPTDWPDELQPPTPAPNGEA